MQTIKLSSKNLHLTVAVSDEIAGDLKIEIIRKNTHAAVAPVYAPDDPFGIWLGDPIPKPGKERSEKRKMEYDLAMKQLEATGKLEAFKQLEAFVMGTDEKLEQ